MPNIKFNYLYRDSGNYKKYGFVIFANPDNLDLVEVEKRFRSKLIDGQCFYADELSLPEVFFECIDFRIDPTWHEFESVEYTEEMPTTGISITQFKQLIEKTNWPQ